MEKNKLILKGGLMLIALSFIFCMGAAFYLKLDIPVFFENNTEIYIYKNGNTEAYNIEDFRIQYLTNNWDNRKVVDITFKEIPDVRFIASEDGFGGWSFPMFGTSGNQVLGETYGRYSLRTIYIKFEQSVDKDLDGIQLENAVITFNNGDVMNTNIGKIVLSENKFDRDYLSQEEGSSSSDGTDTSRYFVKENIVLEKFDSPFLENIKGNIEITIDGKDYRDISGMEYEHGDRFTIKSKLKSPNDILDKFKSNQFDLCLYFKDKDGNLHKTKSHFIHFKPYEYDIKLWDIISYLQQRGAI